MQRLISLLLFYVSAIDGKVRRDLLSDDDEFTEASGDYESSGSPPVCIIILKTESSL